MRSALFKFMLGLLFKVMCYCNEGLHFVRALAVQNGGRWPLSLLEKSSYTELKKTYLK
jgi:hypothetical protein